LKNSIAYLSVLGEIVFHKENLKGKSEYDVSRVFDKRIPVKTREDIYLNFLGKYLHFVGKKIFLSFLWHIEKKGFLR